MSKELQNMKPIITEYTKNMTNKIYGLLVGIDDYPAPVPKLEGCVNDVNAIEDYLRNRLDTNQYELHLQRLTTNGQDEMPTRKAVIAGFEQHLSQATEQDVVLFYYSGHGSQEPAPPEFWHLEPDCMDETLVCWDSRTTDWDLADKELGYLIAQVAKNNPHIICILDSCHSGSGTRDVVPSKGVRHSPADRRSRSIEDFIFSLPDLEAIQINTTTQGTADEPSGWNLPVGRHIVLSGCLDSELASEYSGDGQKRGAFSYFLLDTLQKTNGSLTYRELFKRAGTLVRSRIKDQSPHLESTVPEDLELPFLGGEGAIAKRDSYFTLSYENNRWLIDAGAVHGIIEGNGGDRVQLALYAQGTPVEQMRQLSAAVGEAEVIEVLPHQSVVEIIKAPNGLTDDTVLNAVITSLPLPPLGVYFEGDGDAIDAVRQELQKIGIGGKPSLYVREVENLVDAQYRLWAHKSQYLITKPTDNRPLVKQLDGYSQGNAHKAVENLEHIARWTAVVQLEGTPSSRISANAVTMQFYQADGTEIVNSPLSLTYQYQAGKWKTPTFRLKLTNTSDERLFCTVLDLPENYSVSAPLFPGNNSGIWIEPGDEVWAFRKKEIPASVPDELWKQGVTEYQDVLKLIVSTAEFDASLMCQEGLEQPKLGTRAVPKRNSSLNRLMQRVTTRDIGVAEIDEVDEWLTSQVTVITVRPRDTVSVQKDAQTQLGMGVTLEPHPGLQATANLTTVSQSTRDVGGQILPPILQDNGQPFQFTASRGVDPGLSALEVKITDANTLNTVTPEQPLKLSVDQALGENEYVLPVAYDGEFFLPLGHGGTSKDGKTEITIERLPEPVSQGTRSVGGSIRIFFQKVVTQKLGKDLSDNLGMKCSYPILAAVDVADGQVNYVTEEETVKQRVAEAEKIVLYIHGIFGDTESMVPSVETAIATIDGVERPLKEVYDLVLTFDYENINTPIHKTALKLKQKLRAVGLHPNHGKTLHIVAHSIGGLVARWLIEQEEGNEMVQHLIMLGTPNAGSPWPKVQAGLTTAVTFALNSLSTVVLPLKLLADALKLVENFDVTLDEMEPNSELLQELATSDPPGIPYTILAGNVKEIPVDANSSLKERLSQKLQSIFGLPFFGTSHDLVVAVESITSIPKTIQPELQIQEIACDHLSYFVSPIGLNALALAVASAWGKHSSAPPQALPKATSRQIEANSSPKHQVSSQAASGETVGKDQGRKRPLLPVIGLLLAAAIAFSFFLWKQSQSDDSQRQQSHNSVLSSPISSK